MRVSGFLSRAQVETIHRNALRVLSEVGVQVEHPGVRRQLAEVGGQAGPTPDRVTFLPSVVEAAIAAAPKHPPLDGPPTLSVGSGVYQSRYLDPATDTLVPFTEERLARYVGLARELGGQGVPHLLGLPFVPEDIPPPYLPLAEKLYAWKLGCGADGSVQLTGLCAPLIDLFACHAQWSGRKLTDVFGATGYLISPLRLARPECEQLLYFHARGLRMGVGHLPVQGTTAPVSLAGAVTLSLAETLFLFLLRQAFWGDAIFALDASIATGDLRTGASCYGRPEQARAIWALADLARFYGCACWGAVGLTDAKRPSTEAGAQKSVGALACALATGHGSLDAGLLSMDEICSPLQMVLDHDILGSLRALLANPTVDDTECAFEEICSAGPGGSHLATEFTAHRCHTHLYQPRTWTGEFLGAWLARDCRLDLDRARDFVHAFLRAHVPTPHIPDAEEQELRQIIYRAVQLDLARSHPPVP